MTDTTTSATTLQNYIMYRTKAYMSQPGYTYLEGDTPVIPTVQIIEAAGLVVSTQPLISLTGMTVPDGFAYALDADGQYPVGSIYTPPATTAATAATTGTTTPS